MDHVVIWDTEGQILTPCSLEKARKLLDSGKAELVAEDPLTIRLLYRVERHERRRSQKTPLDGQGRSLLLHVCCGPCATYTVKRLRQENWEVTGFWYNPNIHLYAEYVRRYKSLERFADSVRLALIAESDYDMPLFLQQVAGQERFRQRCLVCYRMRLERTAMIARARGFEAFSTTLLISPYQDQDAIRRIGEGLAQEYGLLFHFENLRRGFSEHYRLAREHDLYMQKYCGCIYSEWEAQDQSAPTHYRG